ncbi:endospore germination permease [Clostridium pasteurianum]|uniref:GerAB/ArcD/ProY family transporter n=1 Tax=Clostridium pasteurianum TaxID=1501 RepID=UPI0022609D93|nr:endospore germination permease [Clostridium pasteurianum]UZW15350.1 endospore germination permease [Clostridium pasteurianum]
MERISNYQLYILTVFFQTGTNIVFGFGAVAGRDAWISSLISTCVGALLVLLYVSIMHMNPGLSLIQWWPKYFGKCIGSIISWMYIVLIVYQISREVGDLKFLISITILPKTSSLVFLSIFMLLIIYSVYSGIEVIARVAQIAFYLLVSLVIIEMIFLYGSKIMDFSRLMPIAGEGWHTIAKGVWPTGILSFSEGIELAMIWPLVEKPKKILKTTLMGIFTFGFFLTIFDVLAVAALGSSIFKNSLYPLYTLIQQISVGQFITNLDAIGVLYLLTNVFFRMSLYMFAAVRGIQQITPVKNSIIFILPVSIISLCWGIIMSPNISEHIEVAVKYFPYTLATPLFVVLPFILFIVSFIRTKKYKVM